MSRLKIADYGAGVIGSNPAVELGKRLAVIIKQTGPEIPRLICAVAFCIFHVEILFKISNHCAVVIKHADIAVGPFLIDYTVSDYYAAAGLGGHIAA